MGEGQEVLFDDNYELHEVIGR